jgi:hypothetical protein
MSERIPVNLREHAWAWTLTWFALGAICGWLFSAWQGLR